MTTDERLLRLEDSFTMLSELASRYDENTHQIIELVRGADERMDNHETWINELGAAQANSEARIAALADAQIRTEAAQANSEARIAALADAQIKTENAIASLAKKVSALTDAQAATDRRLNNLITLFEQHKGEGRS